MSNNYKLKSLQKYENINTNEDGENGGNKYPTTAGWYKNKTDEFN